MHHIIGQLKALRNLVTQNEARIVEALHHDLGRCRMETILSETATTVGEIDLALSHLKVRTPTGDNFQ